jgi:hypothetical protein
MILVRALVWIQLVSCTSGKTSDMLWCMQQNFMEGPNKVTWQPHPDEPAVPIPDPYCMEVAVLLNNSTPFPQGG